MLEEAGDPALCCLGSGAVWLLQLGGREKQPRSSEAESLPAARGGEGWSPMGAGGCFSCCAGQCLPWCSDQVPAGSAQGPIAGSELSHRSCCALTERHRPTQGSSSKQRSVPRPLTQHSVCVLCWNQQATSQEQMDVTSQLLDTSRNTQTKSGSFVVPWGTLC